MQAVSGPVSHHVTLRGLDFHYLTWGDAALAPLVLLHGLTGHAHIWDHVAQALAERFQLFAPDQRGHGDTQHASAYTTRDFTDDVEALRAHWDIERFTLVGLSMGGHNAMSYAAQHPNRVGRLIIIDIPPAFDMRRVPDRSRIEALAREGHRTFGSLDEAVADARLSNTTAPIENLRHRTEHNVREVDGGLMLKYDPKVPATWQPDDLWPIVGTLSMPSLLVLGGINSAVPPAAVARMRETFPRLDVAEVPDSGHSVPTDKPDKLAPILLEWLERTSV
jgi:pimeloyl-ACP methyl ester carboxylesterase